MPDILKRIFIISAILSVILIVSGILGLSMGSSSRELGTFFSAVLDPGHADPTFLVIIWKIRFPRVLLAALVGATLSLAGLVFQALLRNPLAEPYILGISGGAAIGAIIGILAGLSRFPGVGLLAFAGGMGTLFLVLSIASGEAMSKRETLLLSGVMVNAFCSAVIMLLISISMNTKLHSIMFWLMGDLSSADTGQVFYLALMVIPCFVLIFALSHKMNILLMGSEMARSLGVNVPVVTIVLLGVSSFMVSVTVCQCGLIAFVGLVIPHLLRLMLGPDHRVLVPASILGGGAYMVICDLLARTLPQQGEMPAGVITAMIGAPVFIYLLKRSKS